MKYINLEPVKGRELNGYDDSREREGRPEL